MKTTNKDKNKKELSVQQNEVILAKITSSLIRQFMGSVVELICTPTSIPANFVVRSTSKHVSDVDDDQVMYMC